jgi:integrase
MTALRQRFIEDLQLRNRSPRAIETSIHHLKEYARYFQQAPDQLGLGHAHRYLLYLLNDKKVSWSACNQAVSARRFFYRVTCPRGGVVTRLPYGKRPRKLPTVRSVEEVARFLDALRGRVPRMLLRTAYAGGLRLNEVRHLTPQDIDSQRMALRVLGKGQKERLVPLSPLLLDELRQYYRAVKPGPWLFPGQGPQSPLSAAAVRRASHKACLKAGLPRITPHTLRHG